MAEDRDQGAPSLEPPSLFRRKKKDKKATSPAAPPPAAPEPTSTAAATAVPAPTAMPAAPAAPAAAGFAAPDEIAPPGDADGPAAAAGHVESVELAGATGPSAEPLAEQEPETVVVTPPPEADDSPTTILDDVAPPGVSPVPPVAAGAPPVSGTAPPGDARPPREPWMRGRPAAVLTGLLVGALIVAATAGSLRLCTRIKGTSSCGGPGLFLLVAILVVAVLVGAALLRAAAVPQPLSTSFLAVGLISVVTLLFLVGSIFQWWMIIVIPLVAVATFLLSHWVTTAYIEPENEASERQRQAELHDVR